jgi:hypothetical protein
MSRALDGELASKYPLGYSVTPGRVEVCAMAGDAMQQIIQNPSQAGVDRLLVGIVVGFTEETRRLDWAC